jgi:hypothetical protein
MVGTKNKTHATANDMKNPPSSLNIVSEVASDDATKS